MKTIQQYTMFDGSKVLSAAFTTTHATETITSNAHGLSNGDAITMTNSGGALPAGFTAATLYYVINAATNTFQVSTTLNGSAVAISGDGTGTHTFWLVSNQIFVGDADFVNLSIFGNSLINTVTLKVMGSSQQDCPKFAQTVSATNMWDYVDVIDLEDAASIDGDTGITPTASGSQTYSLNTDGLNWIAVTPTALTAGNVKLIATLYYKR
jgi:hypothetical protein